MSRRAQGTVSTVPYTTNLETALTFTCRLSQLFKLRLARQTAVDAAAACGVCPLTQPPAVLAPRVAGPIYPPVQAPSQAQRQQCSAAPSHAFHPAPVPWRPQTLPVLAQMAEGAAPLPVRTQPALSHGMLHIATPAHMGGRGGGVGFGGRGGGGVGLGGAGPVRGYQYPGSLKLAAQMAPGLDQAGAASEGLGLISGDFGYAESLTELMMLEEFLK